jgi:hypothetical protein
MVRDVTPAIEAASSAVIILTLWLHSRHQDTTETLRLLNTTMRSVSMVISVLFVVLTRPPDLTYGLATEASQLLCFARARACYTMTPAFEHLS